MSLDVQLWISSADRKHASVASLPDLVFRNKMQFLQILSDDAPRPFTDLEKRAERTTVACERIRRNPGEESPSWMISPVAPSAKSSPSGPSRARDARFHSGLSGTGRVDHHDRGGRHHRSGP